MSDQLSLFDVPSPARAARAGRRRPPEPEPIQWPGGIRPWDPIDQADTDLGFEYPYVTPRRARQIRRQCHGY